MVNFACVLTDGFNLSDVKTVLTYCLCVVQVLVLNVELPSEGTISDCSFLRMLVLRKRWTSGKKFSGSKYLWHGLPSWPNKNNPISGNLTDPCKQ
jgi:hypothetical protein